MFSYLTSFHYDSFLRYKDGTVDQSRLTLLLYYFYSSSAATPATRTLTSFTFNPVIFSMADFTRF